MRPEHAKKVLAVASGGGHWIQLRRMAPAFADSDVVYVSTLPGYRNMLSNESFVKVRDANRWDKTGLLIQALQLLWLVLRTRPDVVVSTGAAPGYFAVRFGKWMGARTVWIDSIANVEELSLSGQRVRKYADLWLTQWPHLARTEGPFYVGAVM